MGGGIGYSPGGGGGENIPNTVGTDDLVGIKVV